MNMQQTQKGQPVQDFGVVRIRGPLHGEWLCRFWWVYVVVLTLAITALIGLYIWKLVLHYSDSDTDFGHKIATH